MFQNNLFENYTGADATIEIVTMLIVAFALGYLLRWLQNRFWGCEHCAESELEAELSRVRNVAQTQTVEPIMEPVVIVPTGIKKNDLKIVEGIGPKIEEVLHNAGINTWDQLAQSSKDELVGILAGAGDGFHMHDPATWAEQAMMADENKWEELERFQDFLNGGINPKQ